MLKGAAVELVVDVGVPLEPDDIAEIEALQVLEQIDLAKTPVGQNHDLGANGDDGSEVSQQFHLYSGLIIL